MSIDVSAFNLPEDLEHRFESLVGPKDKWRETRDTQIGILQQLGLKPHHRFLDGGCGTLRADLPLIGYLDTGNYHGVDIDDECIAGASELITYFDLAKNKAPTIHLSQTFGLDEFGDSAKMDVIWSYQVFIHLSAEHTQTALNSISHLLHPQGAAYVSVRTIGATEGLAQVGSWRQYPITAGRVEDYEALAHDAGLSMEVLGTLGDFGLPAARFGSAFLLIKLSKDKNRDV